MNDNITVAKAAHVLGIGKNQLFQLLRDRDWINSRAGHMRNAPTIKSTNNGWMTFTIGSYYVGDIQKQTYTPLITPLGMIMLDAAVKTAHAKQITKTPNYVMRDKRS